MQSGQTKYGIGMTVSACLWLGLFPLMQSGTYATITKDKWTYMLLLTGVTAVCFLVDLVRRRLSRPRALPLIAGGALLLCMLVSCLASPYPDVDWWIGAGRREGLASQLCYLSLFFMFSFSRVKRTPVLLAAGCGVTGYLIVALLQRAGGNPLGLYPANYSFENTPLFQGTIGHVDMGAGYLLILCGLFLPAVIDAARERSLPLFLPLLAFLGVTLFLIFTIDVRFAVLTACVFFVWTLVRCLPKKFWLPVLLLLACAAFAFVWSYTGSVSTLQELHEVLHGNIQLSFGSGRIGIWTYSAKLLKQTEYLLTGTGVDTFVIRLNSFLKTWFAEHPDAERLIEFFDSPHNEYLAMLLNCGIPALVCFAILLLGGCFGRTAWRDGVMCYGIQALLSFSVCLVAPMFWVVFGMAWSMPPPKKKEPADPPVR